MTRSKFYIVSRLICLLLLLATAAYSNERYSQMVLSFPDKRPFDFSYIERDNTLLITIKNTLTQELDPIYHYDERLVRRVLFREINGADTEVRIVLRDHEVRASVYSFEEPFRIVIDLFDQQFQERRDPKTGLPLVQELKQQELGNDSHYSPPHPGSEPESRREPKASAHLQDHSHRDSKHRLLHTPSPDIRNPQEFIQKLAEAPEGLSKRWNHYPIYIFRIQTEPYKTGKSYDHWVREQASQAMESGEAMANYAGQLYDFGHEARALIAYQQVLHRHPQVFDRNAKHLWRLAEIHLGQGNFTLSDGYFASLIEKHPDHPLTQFARMRRLDIRMIQAIEQQNPKLTENLAAQIESIRTKDIPELEAQLQIRRVYWQQDKEHIEQHMKDRHWLAPLSPENWIALENSSKTLENPRTGFLISSLLLNAYLNDFSRWNEETSKFAGQYFETYKGGAAEPFRSQLFQRAHQTINQHLETLVKNGQVLQAVKVFESLPGSLNSVRNSADTSWFIAQAYRQLQQPGNAASYYKIAAEKYPSSPQRFRALFWQLEMLQDQMAIEKTKGAAGANIQRIESQYRAVDKQTLQAWKQLKEDEKQQMMIELQPKLEEGITNPGMAVTHPTLLLWAWSQTLGTKTPSAASLNNQLNQRYSANQQTVFLLSQLAQRFGQLGKVQEQRTAKNLIRYLSPTEFRENPNATKLWAKELIELAEIHRQNNEYLEAGRLYTLTGSESENWEGRAEALYKGGLLLYRSGRREEALDAFTKAANDGNNLLYAELAKKRLEQLQD